MVQIYTTKSCGYCHAAKEFFRKKGLAFEEIDVTGEPEKRAWLLEATGLRTVPQVFINGEPIGGFREVMRLEARGELDSLLAGAA